MFSGGMRHACPTETETQNQQAMVFKTKGGNAANESSGSAQDLMQSSGTHRPCLLPQPSADTGRLRPTSLVPGPSSPACTMPHTQNGGCGQLR